MAYRDPYARPNDTYNSIQQIDPNLHLHRPSNTYVPTQPRIDNSPQTRWQPDYSQRGSYQVEPAKKSQIKNRIKEIMELCRGENSAINTEMAGIIREERQVYDLLGRADHESFRPPAPVGPSSQLTPHRQDAGSSLQKDIKSMIYQNSHIQLPEEAHQLINAIEQKALAEIQNARNEVDQYKRRNAELEKELAYYRPQGAPGGAGYENELRSKVAYLEGLLEQQRSSGSSGGIDFNALYAQGEAIRQDTIRLLRLKQAKLGSSDDEEKRRLREEVERLQRRLEQVQHERVGVGRPSKPSYEVINEEYSPIAPAYKRSNSHRNSANQYESLVMEMRKITAN